MAERSLALYARAGLGALPGARALPGIGGRRAAGLPDRTLTREPVTVDRERLAAYDRVCAFPFSDALPGTYPHALAFPLQLELITDPSFPLAALGLVHIANRIVQHRSIDASESLALAVTTADLRPHRRGRRFEIVTEVRAGDELVWEERSTNLRIEHRDDRERDGGESGAEAEAASEANLATWRLPGDLGRRYAAVSGDVNPIHLHAIPARLLGFRGAIAHGMWTTARCLAALAPLVPDAYTLEVAFKRPIVLPAAVSFTHTHVADALEFAVRDARAGTPHLTGMLTTAERP